MKKVFFAMAALVCSMSMSAQIIKVYKGTDVVATYTADQADSVVFAEAAPAPSHDEYVEIGGLKWATKNLGATTVAGSPATCYGDYYAWGETEPRYTSMTISDDGTSATFGGWSSSHSSGYSSSDYPAYTGTTLDADHDAATNNWGKGWRTPTCADFEALVNACTGNTSFHEISSLSTSKPAGGIYWLSSDQTYLSEYKGVAGILFVDKTDTSKRVFFPAAGYCDYTYFESGGSRGLYWSSSLTTNDADHVHILNFRSSYVCAYDGGDRYIGHPIRPVSE